jgi:hypothetical protein
MVKLTNGNVDYQRIAPAGADLRFTDSSGNEIIHEIESFTENGDSFFWVKVPFVAANDTDAHVWAYANHSNAPAPLGGNVWTDGYRGVWHLNGNANDSTPNGLHGTLQGPTSQSAAVGGGYFFDGNDFIDLGPNVDAIRNVSSVTLSAYARLDPAGITAAEQSLISFSVNTGVHDCANCSRAALGLRSTTDVWVVGRSEDAAAFAKPRSLLTLSGDTDYWFTAVIRYADDETDFYLNGSFLSTEASVFGTATTPNTLSSFASMGAEDDGINVFFQGLLDEVRVSEKARTAGWIAAQYQSVIGAFATLGPEETPVP